MVLLQSGKIVIVSGSVLLACLWFTFTISSRDVEDLGILVDCVNVGLEYLLEVVSGGDVLKGVLGAVPSPCQHTGDIL